MPEFKFAIDVKYTCWDRYHLKIEADTVADAIKIVDQKYFDKGNLVGNYSADSYNVFSVGDLDYLSPSENNDNATEELILLRDTMREENIWDNVKKWYPGIHNLKTT